jgi:hypothetical protein
MGEEEWMINLVGEKVGQSWARNTLIPREKLSAIPKIAPFLIVNLNGTAINSYQLAKARVKSKEWETSARKCSLKRSRAGVGLRISSTVWNMSLVLVGVKTMMMNRLMLGMVDSRCDVVERLRARFV